MKISPTFKLLLITTVVAAMACFTVSAEIAQPGKVLDITAKNCKRIEVSNSYAGPRSTVIFYTFKDRNAILSVHIDNKNKDFPVSAKIYTFAGDVTQTGLERWINNQHSDGLFPDVPKPLKTHKVPAASCKATSNKLIDTTGKGKWEHENFPVAFQLKGVPAIEGITVKDLTDKAKVHVKKG